MCYLGNYNVINSYWGKMKKILKWFGSLYVCVFFVIFDIYFNGREKIWNIFILVEVIVISGENIFK